MGFSHNLNIIIKSVRDIMRKDDRDTNIISQRVWMIFLKLFDSMEEEIEYETFKQYCWKVSKEEIMKRIEQNINRSSKKLEALKNGRGS